MRLLHAPITILRPDHDGVPVAKTKVIEVDPRGAQVKIDGIATPRRLPEAFLAITEWERGESA
jgi:hypothetical protein